MSSVGRGRGGGEGALPKLPCGSFALDALSNNDAKVGGAEVGSSAKSVREGFGRSGGTTGARPFTLPLSLPS